MSTEMKEEGVRVEVEGPLGWIVLDRPQKRNAIDVAVLRGLDAAIDQLEVDERVRVVLLRGEGKIFSAGIDTSWLMTGAAKDLALQSDEGLRLRRFIAWIQRILGRLESLEKPTIAMLHGYCGGLGLELALPCDLRVAAEGTQLGLPEIVLGIIPDCGGTTRLTRLAGIARAKELILTGDMIDAAEAERFHIVNRVVEVSELRAETEALAHRLARRSPAALGLSKKLIDLGYGLARSTHLELEALTQSVLMTSPRLGQHMMEGMSELRGAGAKGGKGSKPS